MARKPAAAEVRANGMRACPRGQGFYPLCLSEQSLQSAKTAAARGSPDAASVVTIGTFDGVHLGHQALVRRAGCVASALLESRGARPRVIAMAFDPNPLDALRPGGAPARLTTWAQRERLLREAGADEVVKLEPTPALLGLSAEEFVERLVREQRPVAIVEGGDFRFGARRGGDVALLRELGRRFGYEVEVVDQVEVPLTDHTLAPARSTVLRWLIGEGRVGDAACLLGRPYAMAGRVVRGDRRGRTIGYPTANLDSPCLAPADGVYAGRARLPDGRVLAAAISVGTKPTFGAHARAVEAFLMEGAARGGGGGAWKEIAGLPEYDWPMELEFLSFVRDQVKFDSMEPLLSQMARDCAACWAAARCADECEAVSRGA